MRTSLALLAALLLANGARAAEPFDIREGERVLLIGDTLLEREGTYGYLETRMHEQFPQRHFTVRNLAFSADTPLGISRAAFDPAAKGFERLKEQLALVKPTVAILGYGMAASLQELTDRSGDLSLNPDPTRYGAEPMSAARFKKELAQLMDAISANAGALGGNGEGGERRTSKSGAEGSATLPPNPKAPPSALSDPSPPSPNSPTSTFDVRRSTFDVLPSAPAPSPVAAPGSTPEASGAVAAADPAKAAPPAVRFILLSPIRHEDLRATRPGLPDPAAHNALLAQYSKAIEELAQERGARFVDLSSITANTPAIATGIGLNDAREKLTSGKSAAELVAGLVNVLDQALTTLAGPRTDNGIHLNSEGYQFATEKVATALIWPSLLKGLLDPPKSSAALRAAVVAKNALFFHRWRPANSTYLFGFRKNEQGRNAAEIPQFDPLIEAAEKEIDRLKAGDAPSTLPSGAAGTLLVQNGASGEPGKLSGEPEKPSGKSLHTPGEMPNSAVTGAVAPAPTLTAAAPSRPLPVFTIAEGYEITLWAENPLLEKPTQMNWDAQGRLWVTSSSLYPMIAPGQPAEDKVLILEDTDHDGKADKSTVFATGLLVPTGVEPDLFLGSAGVPPAVAGVPAGNSENHPAQPPSPSARGHEGGKGAARELNESSAGTPKTARETRALPGGEPRAACYVGQSTELLHFADTDGDGVADEKRIVLSGFGTEDTHHIIHTLHWGPDGRLYFNQSVYIHSHVETPWGVVRLNSGGIWAYDPRTERLEVFAKGWWNSWGHQMDAAGQSFATDGAGSTGVSWVIPGAVYPAYEGGKRIAPAISPGSYPKFAGLELLYSPHFPAEWQGNAITCDFRAHRVVRFAIEDLSGGEGGERRTSNVERRTSKSGKEAEENTATRPKPKASPSDTSTFDVRRSTFDVSPAPAPASAGYTAKEQPDFLRTNDVSFRPIDVKLGPDGALYLADWSNPVINHGEVDFRDPRRDHHMGRIWRITRKGAPLVKWEPLGNGDSIEGLTEKGRSTNHWEKEQATRLLYARDAMIPGDLHLSYLRRIDDPSPRMRVFAMRALARVPSARSAELVLDAAVGAAGGEALAKPPSRKGEEEKNLGVFAPLREPSSDAFLEYAAWLSINDLAKPWTDAIASGAYPAEGHEKQLAYGLAAIDPALAGPAVARLLAGRTIPRDGSGPWIELIGTAGGPAELKQLYLGLMAAIVPDGDDMPTMAPKELAWTGDALPRAAHALVEAARLRGLKPENPYTADARLPYYEKYRGKADAPLAIWQFFAYPKRAWGPDVLRLMGLWKVDSAAAATLSMTTGPGSPEAEVAAAFEALRLLGTDNAANLAEEEAASDDPRVRRYALITLAALRPARALPLLTAAFPAAAAEAELVGTWRELLKERAFADQLAAHPPASLNQKVAAAGVRAAKEMGKRGETLLAKLSPLAGIDAAAKNAADANPAAMATAIASGRVGDPARGELIYRRANLGCVICHAIGGAGGKVGPDLSSIGASAPLDYLIESLFIPNAKVKEGYNAVLLTQKGGAQISGVLVRENPDEFILRDITGKELRAPKAAVTARENLGSIMPAGLMDQLADRERLDLFAFLGTLGKPGAFDSSKATVARQWELWPAGPSPIADELPMVKREPGLATFTLVDGRLTRDMIAEKLALFPADTKSLHARSHFTIATAGKTKLTLTGARKAWLDRTPLPIASEPSPTLTLAAGPHDLEIELDPTGLPDLLRAESPDVTFLGE